MQFNLEDWASIIGIAGATLGGVVGLVKVWIINPLTGKIDELNGNFSNLNNALVRSQQDFKRLEDRVDGHDIKFTEHDERIRTLFKREKTSE
ncbi:hypothetical protein [Leuconostoc carnosum]|uniref:hypothetical protein n=1 Tax=Leuconostoc carnosum TaxID=1252 RepID=UPI001239784B|nr:hypothetical protein [Leuconostoc carnosum]KAA8371885.1 hypothetical protein FE415_07350 [Leuconostoc carnosum]KAA8375241.1 hypothetical protein FE408_07095 [Leuconostoc carnosum]KAA8377111.1 hypothetical protein FE405_07340 [Leuconostoc carnosum]